MSRFPKKSPFERQKGRGPRRDRTLSEHGVGCNGNVETHVRRDPKTGNFRIVESCGCQLELEAANQTQFESFTAAMQFLDAKYSELIVFEDYSTAPKSKPASWQPAPSLVGVQFGSLTVIRRSGSDRARSALWLCRCECGKEAIYKGYDLKSGKQDTCGYCMRRKARGRPPKNPTTNDLHASLGD